MEINKLIVNLHGNVKDQQQKIKWSKNFEGLILPATKTQIATVFKIQWY